MSKICTLCYSEVDDNARFCPNCGMAFPDTKEEIAEYERSTAEEEKLREEEAGRVEERKRLEEESSRIEEIKRDHRNETSDWEKVGWGVAVAFSFAFLPLVSLELVSINFLTVAVAIVGLVMGFCCTDNGGSHSLISAIAGAAALMVLSLIPIFLVYSLWFNFDYFSDVYWGHLLVANLSFAVGAIARWAYERNFIAKNHL